MENDECGLKEIRLSGMSGAENPIYCGSFVKRDKCRAKFLLLLRPNDPYYLDIVKRAEEEKTEGGESGK
jgi:hypothetical protein